MDDLRKRLHKTEERLNYLIRVKDSSTWGNLSGFQEKYTHLKNSFFEFQEDELSEKIHELEEALTFIEERCEENLSPMERVRI
ncbi:MAG: acetyl-CoA carboxylase carboxyl transferase subunit alpha/beta, partial [Desulfobulbales bacterium]